jgi:hypothetical protein
MVGGSCWLLGGEQVRVRGDLRGGELVLIEAPN